jgi:hypothetical protein
VYVEAESLLLRAEATMLRPQRPGRPEPRRLAELRRVHERLLALYLKRDDRSSVARYRALLLASASSPRR